MEELAKEVLKRISEPILLSREAKNITFNVEITMYTTEYGRGSRTFYKKIKASNEDEACDFARQMLAGFLAEGVTIKTKVVSK